MELARTTFIVNIIKLVPRWTEARSSRDDTTNLYLIKTEPATRNHEDDAHPGVARNLKPATRRRRWRYTVLSVTRWRRKCRMMLCATRSPC